MNAAKPDSLTHDELMTLCREESARTRQTLARLRPITPIDEETIHGITAAAAANVPLAEPVATPREGRVSRLLRLAGIALGVAHIAR